MQLHAGVANVVASFEAGLPDAPVFRGEELFAAVLEHIEGAAIAGEPVLVDVVVLALEVGSGLIAGGVVLIAAAADHFGVVVVVLGAILPAVAGVMGVSAVAGVERVGLTVAEPVAAAGAEVFDPRHAAPAVVRLGAGAVPGLQSRVIRPRTESGHLRAWPEALVIAAPVPPAIPVIELGALLERVEHGVQEVLFIAETFGVVRRVRGPVEGAGGALPCDVGVGDGGEGDLASQRGIARGRDGLVAAVRWAHEAHPHFVGLGGAGGVGLAQARDPSVEVRFLVWLAGGQVAFLPLGQHPPLPVPRRVEEPAVLRPQVRAHRTVTDFKLPGELLPGVADGDGHVSHAADDGEPAAAALGDLEGRTGAGALEQIEPAAFGGVLKNPAAAEVLGHDAFAQVVVADKAAHLGDVGAAGGGAVNLHAHTADAVFERQAREDEGVFDLDVRPAFEEMHADGVAAELFAGGVGVSAVGLDGGADGAGFLEHDGRRFAKIGAEDAFGFVFDVEAVEGERVLGVGLDAQRRIHGHEEIEVINAAGGYRALDRAGIDGDHAVGRGRLAARAAGAPVR